MRHNINGAVQLFFEKKRKAEELADILLADLEKKIDRVIIGSIKKGVYQIRIKKDEPWMMFMRKR